MQHLGVDGYVERTSATLDAADRMRAGIAALDGVRVLGDGGWHLIAMAAEIRSVPRGRVRARPHALLLGWLGLVPRPPGPTRVAALDGQLRQRAGVDVLADLAAGLDEVGGEQSADPAATGYATLE